MTEDKGSAVAPAPKQQACCFTGHRDIAPGKREHLSHLLWDTVKELAQNGITDFYCGGALGFDTMAAATVLNMKRLYPHVRLILAIPCQGQADRWRPADRILYEKIKERADEAVVLSPVYTPSCMAVRNRYMVDRASVCVAYVQREQGGSASTAAYARRRGCRVINLGAL